MKYALLIAVALAFGASTADAADRNDDAKHSPRHSVQHDRGHDGRHDGWRADDRYRGGRNDHARNDRGWDRNRNDHRRRDNHRWDNNRWDDGRWSRHDRYVPRYVHTPHRNRYHVTRYQPPRGYYAHHWRAGDYLPPVYRSNAYVVDYYSYRLPPPPRGYHYIRVDNHAVLAAIASGLVADVVFDLFYH